MAIDLDRLEYEIFNQNLFLAITEIIEIEIGSQDLIRSYQELEENMMRSSRLPFFLILP
jgi:hypothetical protein